MRIEVADNPEATLKEDAGNFSVDFVQNILKKLDWDAFRATALSVRPNLVACRTQLLCVPIFNMFQLNMDLPVSYSDSDKTDAEFLQLVYDVALSVRRVLLFQIL